MSARKRRCACGGVITAYRGGEQAAVAAHQRTERHLLWLADGGCWPRAPRVEPAWVRKERFPWAA